MIRRCVQQWFGISSLPSPITSLDFNVNAMRLRAQLESLSERIKKS
jgi:hypothetical protein